MVISESLQEAIHFEYISTGISIRQLAAKHGLSKSAIERMIKKGGWSIEKRGLSETAYETARRQTETKVGRYVDVLAERAEKVYSATDKLLALVDAMLANAEAMAPRDLQAMSATLMNIKQLHDIRPPEEDKTSTDINVRMTGDVAAWSE